MTETSLFHDKEHFLLKKAGEKERDWRHTQRKRDQTPHVCKEMVLHLGHTSHIQTDTHATTQRQERAIFVMHLVSIFFVIWP